MTAFTNTYRTYIESAHWRYVMRPKVFAHYGYRCMNPRCPHRHLSERENPFQVDHLRYPPRNAPIESFMKQPVSDFQILCKKCHAAKTKESRKK